ncbi:Os12g0568600 [Oryza sativa Japonica Group]|uniref:Os12g0568600 protein n=1 Tax=Oryza sativa subsp. japonica TaxID=39947 RepID=A0A0P0YC20_ORYSJ|nr:Os12g0568600 [Oryza sativa Japonica Group]
METVATEPGTCLRRLPDDLVADEILTRLPARSLARFASVCGAWRAAISGDPSSFLRRRRKKEHSSSFLLLLYALVEDAERRLAFSNHVPFYRLRWPDDGGDGAPQLVHVSVFGDGGEEPTLSLPRTCDGLVLLPNGDDVHVINPATGDVLTLPQSSRVAAAADHSTGLGLDTRTNTYKVARYIHLSTAAAAAAAEDDGAAVMEVFTIGHGDAAAWRETTTPPPPSYPKGVHLYHHDSGGGEESVREVARMDEFEFEWSFPGEPYAFMVIPYTESLVRVTAARPINKTAAATAMAGETAATMMATPERPKRARRANSRYIGDMWDV